MPETQENAFAEALRWDGPAIGLLDLDAFFASVEELDHPEWRGQPIIVGDPEGRSVVSTASYEARRYGVRSAMPSSQARRLCPNGIWCHPRFERYRELSDKVMGFIGDETPFVEQVSIDEAFFDVTPGRFSRESPIAICRRIQERVASLGITCSIGLSTSKSVSKIASEREKPRGLTVVLPGSERTFMAPLGVRELSGIGPAMESKLRMLGIRTLGELADADPFELEGHLGSYAHTMVARAAGKEQSAVRPQSEEREVKSVSNERTFDEDLVARDDIAAATRHVAGLVAQRLRAKDLKPKTIGIKVRYEFESTVSAQAPLARPANDDASIVEAALSLLGRTLEPGRGVRLIGVSATGFDEEAPVQLTLDDASREQSESISKTMDDIRRRFGSSALGRGSDLRYDEMRSRQGEKGSYSSTTGASPQSLSRR